MAFYVCRMCFIPDFNDLLIFWSILLTFYDVDITLVLMWLTGWFTTRMLNALAAILINLILFVWLYIYGNLWPFLKIFMPTDLEDMAYLLPGWAVLVSEGCLDYIFLAFILFLS